MLDYSTYRTLGTKALMTLLWALGLYYVLGYGSAVSLSDRIAIYPIVGLVAFSFLYSVSALVVLRARARDISWIAEIATPQQLQSGKHDTHLLLDIIIWILLFRAVIALLFQ